MDLSRKSDDPRKKNGYGSCVCKRKERDKKKSCDRNETLEQWSGRKRRGSHCEQEDGVTAANQISLSLGCLMSILLCDSHRTTLSAMNKRSTRFSKAPLLHSQIREGMH